MHLFSSETALPCLDSRFIQEASDIQWDANPKQGINLAGPFHHHVLEERGKPKNPKLRKPTRTWGAYVTLQPVRTPSLGSNHEWIPTLPTTRLSSSVKQSRKYSKQDHVNGP